jgi:Uma2 family endonuclease
MVSAPRLGYSFREYVRFETDAHEKHEFVSGLILAMAGGTLEHAGRIAKVIALLGNQLADRRCRVFDSNARIRVPATGNAYYPDASVFCGRVETDPEDGLSATNPDVLVEVLSPSTAEYDRTDKLEDYRRISSLRHIVHVAHDAERIAVWTRDGASWTEQTYERGQRADLGVIQCVLDVSEVYRDPLT